MDFDLSSAKPENSQEFDLSSASVGNQSQSSAYVPMSAASRYRLHGRLRFKAKRSKQVMTHRQKAI